MPLALFLLGFAVIAAWGAPASEEWRGSSAWWKLLLLAACIAALYEGLVDPAGVPFLAALWGASHLWCRARSRRARLAWATTAVVVAAALATHRMPGFSPYRVAESVRLSPASAEMTLNANFDKGFAGVMLLAYFCDRRGAFTARLRAFETGGLYGIATAVVVIGMALAAGAVAFDPKLPSLTPAWMAINLLLTCVFEEALFRGLLQEQLSRLVGQRPRLSWLPVTVASLLFGLAHTAGGVVLIVVAGLAGVGYGLAYAASRRIEASIAAHFTLNSLHFLAFTYPYAVR